VFLGLRYIIDVQGPKPALVPTHLYWLQCRESNVTFREILADIHALEEDLLQFERKYGLRSETFYAAFMSGEEPEDEAWVLDFNEWAGIYRSWLARQAEYRNEIQRVQPNGPTLSGLVNTSA
jgi:hypothetical protein